MMVMMMKKKKKKKKEKLIVQHKFKSRFICFALPSFLYILINDIYLVIKIRLEYKSDKKK